VRRRVQRGLAPYPASFTFEAVDRAPAVVVTNEVLVRPSPDSNLAAIDPVRDFHSFESMRWSR